MKRVRRGFTLVEVSLFLAITAAVFMGVAIGTQNSIFQQRYNDAVQNYAEFLRSVYSQVTNVQSESTGRSGKAIYGKLVTFNDDNGENKINTYNVIGDVVDSADTKCSEKNSVLEKLDCLDANVIIKNDGGVYKPVGFVENYMPRWSSQIQTTNEWTNGGYQLFTGALLIVRSPATGTVHTYVSKEIIDVDGVLSDEFDGNKNVFKVGEVNYLGSFHSDQVDFCINPNGPDKSSLWRDVRIIKNARNASGIEIVPDDENGCQQQQ